MFEEALTLPSTNFGHVARYLKAQKKERGLIVEGLLEGAATEVKPENVEHFNSLQVLDAARCVFSNKNDFSIVKEMIKADESVRRGTRLVEGCFEAKGQLVVYPNSSCIQVQLVFERNTGRPTISGHRFPEWMINLTEVLNPAYAKSRADSLPTTLDHSYIATQSHCLRCAVSA